LEAASWPATERSGKSTGPHDSPPEGLCRGEGI